MRRLWTRVASCPRRFFVVAAISVITLAASSPIYSAASGGQVAGRTSASPVAIARPSVSGRCSRAVANRLLKQLHLGPKWPEPNPAAQVLCGAFTGPGSQAMAVTFSAPTCWSPQGWAVFRQTGGAWRLILRRNEWVFPLIAVGSDIRERAPVFRSGDPVCFPSGGTHDRIWHWNGRRFTHSTWMPSKTVHLDDFLSPDRKVWCRIYKPPPVDEAWCVTMNPEHSGTVKRNGDVTICSGPGPGDCTQNWDKRAPVLRYGQQSELYGYRCKPETKGITCTVIAGAGKGKGFLINSSGVSRVGP